MQHLCVSIVLVLTLLSVDAAYIRRCRNGNGYYTDQYAEYDSRYSDIYMCKQCPEGTYSSNGAAVQCTPCPVGMTTYATGARLKRECTKCDNGYVEVNGTCEPCPVGTYSGIDWATERWTCEKCSDISGIGLVTTAGVASISSDNCSCPLGYKQRKSYLSGGCEPCPIGWYKDAMGPQCTQCPPFFTTTNTTSRSKDDCICSAGTFMDTSVGYCVKCGIGSYSEVGSTICTECSSGRTTVEETSDDISDCVCKPGYFVNDFTNDCMQCPENSYTDKPNSKICSKCPVGQVPSDDRSHCVDGRN